MAAAQGIGMNGLVLLVDDEEDFVATLAERMRARGMDVETSCSAQDALGKVREHAYDVIVLDLAMPEMDGWAATQRIREDPETAHIPMIALTVHTLPRERKRALDAGVNAQIIERLHQDADHPVALNFPEGMYLKGLVCIKRA